ncbi:hypothetical protein [Halobacillus faecis]|uniref:Tyr recombinase domain-containing protein n=1 Tax=Halobacillus faecis TaxID=360184 RepID=A0A511WWL0_9BACI|nr:hypothetical protein [Halobacillus faecis]GEN55509.1 hypothetical protein HFA01_37710 [Halobacillus faecis]
MGKDEKKLRAQNKKIEKVLKRAQESNAAKKKELIGELRVHKKGSPEYSRISQEISKVGTISDGTVKTYSDQAKGILKEANQRFGVREWKHFKPEHAQKILQSRIDQGMAANSVRKTAHALEYINKNVNKVNVFKKNQKIEVTDHKKMLETIKQNGVVRRAKDSHRLKANPEQARAVIKEMEKYNKHYADIARYQLLSGFRITEAVSQKAEYIDLENNKHQAIDAKGGLNNVVYTSHHTKEDKEFLQSLKNGQDAETGRVFERLKDKNGNYRKDSSVSKSVTRLARKCADKLGIEGAEGQTFSSHSFRGVYGLERMEEYAAHHDKLDGIIEEKIREQPRLYKKYVNFEARIREKIIVENRGDREITKEEKIRWLVSTDLNHSRQEVVRFYVDNMDISAAVQKYS